MGEQDKKDDPGNSPKAPEKHSSKEGKPEAEKGEDELVEVEDDDDYLLYLEVILRTIHTAYYDLYDQMRERKDSTPSTSSSSPSPSVPDLKTVIPYVKRKVISKSLSNTRTMHYHCIYISGTARAKRGVQRHCAYPYSPAQEQGLQGCQVPWCKRI